MMMGGRAPQFATHGGPEISEEVEINVEQKRTRGGATSIDKIVTHEGDEDEESAIEDSNDGDMAF